MKEVPVLTNSKKEFFKTKAQQNKILRSLGAPHVDSFNYMLEEGLADCAKNIHPIEFELPSGDRVKLFIESISIAQPQVPNSCLSARNKKIYPTECRQRAGTYTGACTVGVGWAVNGLSKPTVDKSMGEIPVMLRSKACNLNGLTPEQLTKRGEHENEWGGYFVMKGHEKLIRMLLMTRKNFPITVQRNTWKDRGQHFGDIGIMVRTVRTDQTATTNVLHYLTNGTAKFMFTYRKTFSFIPVVLLLKSLKNCTDEYIYQRLIAGYEDDQYYDSCIQKMLRSVHDETGMHTHEDCKNYLGEVFRSKFYHLPAWKSHVEITDYMLNECILIHLDDHEDKFNFIVLMTQKLFQCAQNKYKIENSDSVMMQEVLLGGHLYQKVIKDRVENWLEQLRYAILKQSEQTNFILNVTSFTQACKIAGSIERTVSNFLSTGNLVSKSGLGLMQASGLVIMAENINRMRYMSHFRAVHRGSFFVEMRTTEARQLLPDAWGFICPVHTPDGSPCGLLNHLTIDCVVSESPKAELVDNVPRILVNLGMVPLNSARINYKNHFVVMLEGKVIGHINKSMAQQVCVELRLLKIEGKEVPKFMEIVLVPDIKNGQYPGLFLFVGPARMMRPVTNLKAKKIEYIGSFEQVYMNVCIDADEAYEGVTTHMEISKTAFMSNLANLIPMPDCNQSPRNMYQCQMGKQTMGTPTHTWQLQSETKLYRLQTPATPLFRPVHHDNIEMDDFAMGTNALIAVISYTGYDMEDAMIINKSADERGFAHGSIYKSQFIELDGTSFFARNPHDKKLDTFIDNDGLPYPGRRIKPMEVLYCYFDTNESVYKTKKYTGSEECVVDNVKLCGTFNADAKKIVCLTLRVPRNPTVGDKFASRAGQKGILSQKWPAEDLPFTESGLIPDIVFNPHGFPSRMTIAMMIETMAGKSGALHGFVHDATPFRFDEKNTAIDHFGRLLQAGGYNYYGTERVYSGIDGREMTADIFLGVVHYQRLRHMVSDKWQCRSTGAIDNVTHQPVKGRKRGGGVRFGEMERDALIAHGASFLLQDRLLHCSDKISTIICKSCGTLLGPVADIVKQDNDAINRTSATCRLCKDKAAIENIQIPYIFKYLVAQLSSVNINVKMNLSSI